MANVMNQDHPYVPKNVDFNGLRNVYCNDAMNTNWAFSLNCAFPIFSMKCKHLTLVAIVCPLSKRGKEESPQLRFQMSSDKDSSIP